MPHFWRDTDGRLRKGILALLLLILSDALYTTAKEGWRLVAWAPALLLLIGLIALAPAAGEARQTWAVWCGPSAIRRMTGIVAIAALVGIVGYDVVTGLLEGLRGTSCH